MLNIQANHKLAHGVGTAALWRVQYETTKPIAKNRTLRQKDN
jgi:hypothetical protein